MVDKQADLDLVGALFTEIPRLGVLLSMMVEVSADPAIYEVDSNAKRINLRELSLRLGATPRRASNLISYASTPDQVNFYSIGATVNLIKTARGNQRWVPTQISVKIVRNAIAELRRFSSKALSEGIELTDIRQSYRTPDAHIDPSKDGIDCVTCTMLYASNDEVPIEDQAAFAERCLLQADIAERIVATFEQLPPSVAVPLGQIRLLEPIDHSHDIPLDPSLALHPRLKETIDTVCFDGLPEWLQRLAINWLASTLYTTHEVDINKLISSAPQLSEDLSTAAAIYERAATQIDRLTAPHGLEKLESAILRSLAGARTHTARQKMADELERRYRQISQNKNMSAERTVFARTSRIGRGYLEISECDSTRTAEVKGAINLALITAGSPVTRRELADHFQEVSIALREMRRSETEPAPIQQPPTQARPLTLVK